MAARVIEARLSRLSRRILSSMGIAVLLTAGIIETSSAIELDVNGQVTVQFAGFVSYNKPGGGMLNAGSVELTGPFPGVPFFDGVAASSAAPGLLRAISTFSYATTVGGVLFLASSQAAFTDSITVSGPGVAFVSVTGEMEGFGTGSLNLLFGTAEQFQCNTSVGSLSPASASCTTPKSPAGAGLLLREVLSAGVSATSASGTDSKILTSDFSNTAFIATIEAFDVNGKELTNFTVSSESGFAYHTGPLTSVPEPFTFLLLASGFIALVIAARKT